MGSIEQTPDIDGILSALTLDEKVGLLAAKDWWRTLRIEKNGCFVPHIKMTDGPNGARGESYVSGIKAACFPCATSLGSSFDVDLLFQVGREVGIEAKTKSANVLLAPTLNVIRAPLGGRNYETYSEDPLVLGCLAAALVFDAGCQSVGIAATPKHFVGNEAENRRVYLTAEIDEQTLREIYLYPFQLVLKNSRPLCWMTSYNRVNGKYVADDSRLLEDILRREWGFEGVILSDWMGTYSTAQGLNAGVDLEMPGPSKWRGPKLLKAIADGQVLEGTVNKSVRRILQLAKALDRWSDPVEMPERETVNPRRDAFICDTAAEGMVLLKNEKGTLPLRKNAKIAIMGHHGQVASLGGGGSARVDSIRSVTPLEGLREAGFDCTFEPGVPVFRVLPHADQDIVSCTDGSLGPDALKRPVILEWFNGSDIGRNLAHKEMIPRAEYMIKEKWPAYLNSEYCTRITLDVTPKTSGSHILGVSTTGKAICSINGVEVFHREQETELRPESFYFFKSKIERRFSYQMVAGQRYSIVLESWATDPEILNKPPVNGMMFQGTSFRFFEFVDIPKRILCAAELAEISDYAIICVGTNDEIESEGYDRDSMDLFGQQYDLIRTVAAKNANTIVVNFSGGPVTMTQFVDHVSAIVQAWFPGQECGHSLAKLLSGNINPSGRLPFSWPKRDEDSPAFENFPVDGNDFLHYKEGLNIGYRYYDREDTPQPLFSFGFGLSYTTFELTDVKISASEMSSGPAPSIDVSCHAKNTGDRFGKVVIQFYLQALGHRTGLKRPVKELKAFKKAALDAGQAATVTVTLDKYSVSFYDVDTLSWRAPKGSYRVYIGTSSIDIASSVDFSVSETFTWSGL